MREIATDIAAIVGACLTIAAILYVFIVAFVWLYKSYDKETDYLRSLSDEERLIISNYRLYSRVKFREIFKKSGKKNEDK